MAQDNGVELTSFTLVNKRDSTNLCKNFQRVVIDRLIIQLFGDNYTATI